jgi:hypothetical protein
MEHLFSLQEENLFSQVRTLIEKRRGNAFLRSSLLQEIREGEENFFASILNARQRSGVRQ